MLKGLPESGQQGWVAARKLSGVQSGRADQFVWNMPGIKGTRMFDLKLREEFRGKRLKGTTVDFTNQSKTGALDVPAAEFLKITYPSFDLLKTIEATSPGQSRPVVPRPG